MRRLAAMALVLTSLISILPLQHNVASAAQIGTGLSLYYKNDSSWISPPAAFTTSTCHTSTGEINFNWGGGGPGGSCGSDNFTGYGVGYILAPVTGTVTFCEQSDDQFYLTVNSTLIIDDNTAKAAATGQSCNGTGTVSMVAGMSYSIQTWVHEQGGGAEWRLLWSYPGQSSYVIVPLANLNPTTFAPSDTTAPTFPSADTFNSAENSTSVGTITTSESATITLFGGDDQARFSLNRLTSSSALLAFISAPNFEAPSDVGSNNTYIVIIKATDDSANAGYETVTVTVTDVVETSTFNAFVLAGNATITAFNSAIQISSNVSVSSRVTFKVNNTRIPGCTNVRTSGVSPNIVATCNWKPALRGHVVLTATALPIAAGVSSSNAAPLTIFVGRRTGTR
jgi:hypothetical protein